MWESWETSQPTFFAQQRSIDLPYKLSTGYTEVLQYAHHQPGPVFRGEWRHPVTSPHMSSRYFINAFWSFLVVSHSVHHSPPIFFQSLSLPWVATSCLTTSGWPWWILAFLAM